MWRVCLDQISILFIFLQHVSNKLKPLKFHRKAMHEDK
jgi:hypothetical protein